ncbi:MAG: transcriptional coactivator p15/PC4 family protein [Candidatus Aminicenantales bacterium]
MTEEKPKLVAEFEKNSAEMIRVHLLEWKTQVYIDIRAWFRAEGNVLRPTTKGVRLNAELLPELRSAIDAVISALEDGPEVEIIHDEPTAGEENRA